MTRRHAVQLLAVAANAEQGEPCDQQANRLWNTFAIHCKDYLEARDKGVIDAKLRARIRRDFEAVMACQCF